MSGNIDDTVVYFTEQTIFDLLEDEDVWHPLETEDTIFKDEIQRNGAICSNCFRRTHKVWSEWWPSWFSDSLTEVLTDKRFRTENAERSVIMGELVSQDHMGSCCKCGNLSNSTTWRRPLTRDQSLECLHRIIEHLDEFDFDENDIYDTWSELKAKPSWQCKDDTIFDIAIELAINDRQGSRPGEPSASWRRGQAD